MMYLPMLLIALIYLGIRIAIMFVKKKDSEVYASILDTLREQASLWLVALISISLATLGIYVLTTLIAIQA